MITQLQQLAKKLNLTDQIKNEEPYLLTKKEELEIIDFESNKHKKHYAWKLAQAGISEDLILLRVAKKDWTVDIKEILREANSRKNQAVWHEEQRRLELEREKQRQGELAAKYSAKYMFQLMRHTSQEIDKPLIVNEFNKHLITALCYFLSNDPKFEDDLGYSFKKGLFIRGIPGIGKTHLVRCVAKNKLNPVGIISIMDVNDRIAKEGYFNINFDNILYLDDVGTEEAFINVYGTKVSFFKNFIEEYYSAEKRFCKLFISTNLSFQQIEEKYGTRIRGRLREMFNVIDVDGKDMRK